TKEKPIKIEDFGSLPSHSNEEVLDPTCRTLPRLKPTTSTLPVAFNSCLITGMCLDISPKIFVMITWLRSKPKSRFLANWICRYITEVHIIKIMAAVNWVMTNPFRIRLLLPAFLLPPFNVVNGSKEERKKAG